MVTIANLMILDTFCQTTRGEHLPATTYDTVEPRAAEQPAPTPAGRPPPAAS